MNAGGDDRSFVIETDEGPLRVLIATSVLRSFAGRSHVTVSEVLEIYRLQFEQAARIKSMRSGSRVTIRLESSDL